MGRLVSEEDRRDVGAAWKAAFDVLEALKGQAGR